MLKSRSLLLQALFAFPIWQDCNEVCSTGWTKNCGFIFDSSAVDCLNYEPSQAVKTKAIKLIFFSFGARWMQSRQLKFLKMLSISDAFWFRFLDLDHRCSNCHHRNPSLNLKQHTMRIFTIIIWDGSSSSDAQKIQRKENVECQGFFG